MDKNDCIKEKIVERVIGFLMIGLSTILAFAGLLLVPVLGAFFATPTLILGIIFIFSHGSRECQLLLHRAG